MSSNSIKTAFSNIIILYNTLVRQSQVNSKLFYKVANWICARFSTTLGTAVTLSLFYVFAQFASHAFENCHLINHLCFPQLGRALFQPSLSTPSTRDSLPPEDIIVSKRSFCSKSLCCSDLTLHLNHPFNNAPNHSESLPSITQQPLP